MKEIGQKAWEWKWDTVQPKATVSDKADIIAARAMNETIELVWPFLRDAVKPKVGEIIADFGMNIYSSSLSFAQSKHQVVGDKNDYYVTLWQLEELLKKFG